MGFHNRAVCKPPRAAHASIQYYLSIEDAEKRLTDRLTEIMMTTARALQNENGYQFEQLANKRGDEVGYACPISASGNVSPL